MENWGFWITPEEVTMVGQMSRDRSGTGEAELPTFPWQPIQLTWQQAPLRWLLVLTGNHT